MTSRWCVNTTKWDPDLQEWAACLAAVQSEEQARIGRFKFKRDAKTALVGRLCLRLLVKKHLGLQNSEIVLARSKENKPFLVGPEGWTSPLPGFQFNISHHGDFVAAASESSCLCGVDVMKIEVSGTDKSVPRFLESFTGVYTPLEWKVVHSAAGLTTVPAGWEAAGVLDKREFLQLAQFYRLWTLKEAFIKAIGIGFGFDLLRAEFRQDIKHVNAAFDPSKVETGTKLYIDKSYQKNWRFEQHVLDPIHNVCVGLGPFAAAEGSARDHIPRALLQEKTLAVEKIVARPFEMLSVRSILEELER
mmetsp:Transcript_26452/g.66558  ORF Transcript_26452/g.66558 Transcript_26452/m.66558 type:complete len:304 (-) Transcript_26452:89-1000(-)